MFPSVISSSLRCLMGAFNGRGQSGAGVAKAPRRTRQRRTRITLDDVIAGLAFGVISLAGFIIGMGL